MRLVGLLIVHTKYISMNIRNYRIPCKTALLGTGNWLLPTTMWRSKEMRLCCTANRLRSFPLTHWEVLDITSCTPVIILGCILEMRRGVDQAGCNAKYVRFTRSTV